MNFRMYFYYTVATDMFRLLVAIFRVERTRIQVFVSESLDR